MYLTKKDLERIIELMDKFESSQVKLDQDNSSGIGSVTTAKFDVIIQNEPVTIAAIINDHTNW